MQTPRLYHYTRLKAAPASLVDKAYVRAESFFYLSAYSVC